MFNYNKWKEIYYLKEYIDIYNYLSEQERNILEDLDIRIEGKLYTENEFEVLYYEVLRYYRIEEELKESMGLPKNIKIEEDNQILGKMAQVFLMSLKEY